MKVLAVVSIVATLIFLAGCSKDDVRPRSFSYSIDTVQDLSLRRGASIGIPVMINAGSDSGAAETVTLSLKGLPAGVTATIQPSSGIPGFAANVLVFAGMNSSLGTYPVRLVGRSEQATVVERPFNLTVRSEDCAMDFVGAARDGSRLCARPGNQNFSSDIVPGPGVGQLLISNFANYQVDAIVDLNCDRGTVAIAPKTYQGAFSLSGQGTFTPNTITLRIIYSDTSMTKDTCTVRYNR